MLVALDNQGNVLRFEKRLQILSEISWDTVPPWVFLADQRGM